LDSYFLAGKTHLFDFYDEATFKSVVPTSQPKSGTVWTAQGQLFREGILDLKEIARHQRD
jgi:hypothetical protein